MTFDDDYATDTKLFVANTSVEIIRCTNRRTRASCAAKVYNKAKFSEHRIALSLEEARIGQSIPAHPNVVRTLACYNDAQSVSIVMEYMPAGTLYQQLSATGPLSEPRAVRLVADVLKGLAHLHENKVMHRDVKPENLFLRITGATALPSSAATPARAGDGEALAIGDFGFATSTIPNDQCVGSPQYSAPELALIALKHAVPGKAKPLYNEKCDIWSVGIVAFVMLTGLMPFDGATPTEVFGEVLKNQLPMHLPACRRLSPQAKAFISQLTNTNPSARPSAKQALRHSWLL